LRVLGLLVRCPSAGRPLPPRRCMSPPSGSRRCSILGKSRLSHHVAGCPLWVKNRHFATQSRCPLYPRKRTLEPDGSGGFFRFTRLVQPACLFRREASQNRSAW
jgi:hypothetical protein